MTHWKNLLFNITVAANSLLCFLLLFESALVIPPWLQVAGRMHPLVLHFPIVLLVLFIGQRVILRLATRPTPDAPRPPAGPGQPDNTLLLLAAFTASITALMGLLLSKEPGYDPDSLSVHKWSGVCISLLTLAWYAFYDRTNQTKYAVPALTTVSLALLLLAGHEGAGITHGENFLLSPIRPNTPQRTASFDDAVVFTDMVQPILKNKCMGCHNSSKAKGELVMETTQLLLKGGKSGPLWDSSKADLGLMMERIHLGPDEEKHMPPHGKPQLTDQELTIIYQWLKHDPNRSIRVAELPATDTLRLLAQTLFKNAPEDKYDFEAADEKTIEKLNTSYRVIYPVALHSPALNVDFYSPKFFKPEQFKELEPLARQVVSLDLDKMPVTDADIPAITHFINLRTLNLSFTGITGAGIAQLCKLEKLKTLSLSGTAVKADDIACFMTQKSLRHLYVWNTAIPPGSIPMTKNSSLIIEGGSRMDTVLVKLNPPILGDFASIVQAPETLSLKHYVPGAVIRYTLDGADPDTTNSLVYKEHVVLTEKATLKARAFKKGWLPSDAILNYFYSERYRPDSIRLLQPIDSNYRKYGAKTLIDLTKGDENFGSGKWLGFRKNNMECLLLFKKPVDVSEVTLSALVNTGASIMPPAKIEVWGGSGAQNMRLLAHQEPEQPATNSLGYTTPYDLTFSPVKLNCLRIVVTPVAKLPDWQQEKGKKGWIFLDEVFVN